MTKNFIAAVVIGVLVLIIFSYFAFGLNGASSNSNLLSQITPAQSAPTQTIQSQATSSATLQVTDEKIGSGSAVKKGDTIVINYIGMLTNGKKFDSSYDRKQPFTTQIGVGQVIKGWDEGVIGMKVGGERKLVIPPSLGYGNQAVGSIPANSTLIFVVELVGIKK